MSRTDLTVPLKGRKEKSRLVLLSHLRLQTHPSSQCPVKIKKDLYLFMFRKISPHRGH